MWANTVWGLLGFFLAFALARMSMLWTRGYEWLGPWLTGASFACFISAAVVFIWPSAAKRFKKKSLLSFQGFVIPFDYAPGSIVKGIKWQAGFTHSTLILSNSGSEHFLDVRVTIKPERWIIQAKSESMLNDCKLGPRDFGLNQTVLATTKSGNKMAVSPTDSDENIIISSHYYFYCSKFVARSNVRIDLATVLEGRDVMAPMFSSSRHDPNFIDLSVEYTAYGEKVAATERVVLRAIGL